MIDNVGYTLTKKINVVRSSKKEKVKLNNCFDVLNICEGNLDNNIGYPAKDNDGGHFPISNKFVGKELKQVKRGKKVMVYSDGHGRGLASNLLRINPSVDVVSTVKLGARFKEVTDGLDGSKLSSEDTLILCADVNDVYSNNVAKMIKQLVKLLLFLSLRIFAKDMIYLTGHVLMEKLTIQPKIEKTMQTLYQ